MKKILLLSALLFAGASVLAGEAFMDKALSSWVGYPITSVIKSWGYPDSQQTIAGQNIYIWEERTTSQDSTYEHSTVSTDKKGNTHVNTYTSGGGFSDYYCRKIFEVGSDNIVSGYQYKGNACPGAYLFVGKKLVNPQNDEWQQRKLEKQMQKRGY